MADNSQFNTGDRNRDGSAQGHWRRRAGGSCDIARSPARPSVHAQQPDLQVVVERLAAVEPPTLRTGSSNVVGGVDVATSELELEPGHEPGHETGTDHHFR